MKLIEKAYRSNLFIRNDNPNGIFYFSAGDFPGLQAHPFECRSSMGHGLKGYFYCYDHPAADRLGVFDHGMGNGHRAYLREIERLAQAGFLVFSYDHTGCMESGGENTNGFAQSLRDLDDVLKALKKVPELSGRGIAVVGHSWGGFSALNITAFHPEITHCVVFSGFSSVERMVKQFFKGPLAPYRKAVLEYERSVNPKHSSASGLDTVINTKSNMLLVYSDNDKMVNKKAHFDPLVKAAAEKEDVGFMLTTGKGHNPNYTYDAVKYLGEFFKEQKRRKRKGLLESDEAKAEFIASYDWMRMTCQDSEVWDDVFAFLAAEHFH